MAASKKPKAAFVLLVKDHMDHGVGCSASALDVKSRVTWAWDAAKCHPAVKRGSVTLLTLNVGECTVNGSKTSELAEMLDDALASADKVLPAVAQSWDSDAPPTLRGNVSAKLADFEKVKRRSLSSVRRQLCGPNDPVLDCILPTTTVEEAVALPMTNLQGAKRAAQAMMVASIFAAELSAKEHVPVLVLGRPPGHHATCAHRLALGANQRRSPGGALGGASLGGGCFYPSCWLAAVHCMREGLSQRLAYIDIDAHKPDGVWKEVDHLCKLGSERRAVVLEGKPDACEGVLFASVHVSGYPNQFYNPWNSVTSTIPKGHKRAFPLWIQEELLPGEVATGTLKNEVVLDAFERWRTAVGVDLRSLKPNGLFIGLGFDLHKFEKEIGDKHVGIGLMRQHYRKLIQDFPSSALKGPVVMTLEGGYTKAGIKDGMLGVLSGLDVLSRRKRSTSWLQKARKSSLVKLKKIRSTPTSSPLRTKHAMKAATTSSDRQKRLSTSSAKPSDRQKRLSTSSVNSPQRRKQARRLSA